MNSLPFPLVIIALVLLSSPHLSVQAKSGPMTESFLSRKGKFKRLGLELELGRSGHCLSLISGHLVFVGGGGWGDWGGEAKAEIINLQSGQVHTVQKQMTVPRSNARLVTLPDGRLMLLGGSTDFEVSLRSTEIFEPKSEDLQAGPDMAFERSGHTASVLNDGRIFIVGGMDSDFVHDSIELFDPKTKTFQTLSAKLAEPRMNHTATLIDDRFLVIAGGETGPSPANPDHETAFLSSVEVYDIRLNSIIAVKNKMTSPKTFHTAVAFNDKKVVFVGGLSALSESSDELEVFDLNNLKIHRAGKLTIARSLHAMAHLKSGDIFISGGVSEGIPQRSTERCRWTLEERFDCRRDAAMSTARWMHENQVLPDGRLLVLGGLTNVAEPGRSRPGPSHSAEIFLP